MLCYLFNFAVSAACTTSNQWSTCLSALHIADIVLEEYLVVAVAGGLLVAVWRLGEIWARP